MKIDIHFHVLGNGRDLNAVDRDVYFYADDNQHWFTRLLYNLVEEDVERLGADLNRDGKISTSEYFELAHRLLTGSGELDAIVLLALDAVYTPGTNDIDKVKTDLYVSNKFLFPKVREMNQRLAAAGGVGAPPAKKFFFGASVNPHRRDWEAELTYVLTKTNAVLLKWIPSTQHIRVDDPAHKRFYEMLAAHRLPLLCHVGPEYSFPEGIRRRELDNYSFLEKPLQYGVSVIAAHCAAPVFPIGEDDHIQGLYKMMQQVNRGGKVQLWADTSALSLATRVSLIPEIVKTFPAGWLVHGSDFPIPIDGWPHLPWITRDMTITEYLDISRTKNPLDRDVEIKRAHGFSDTILENGVKVLRLPQV
jgi:predicted TIM-barrel fold metal-dependent hydrolase